MSINRVEWVVIEYIDEAPSRVVGWCVDQAECERWLNQYQVASVKHGNPRIWYVAYAHSIYLSRFVTQEDS